jgi:hypothetical protein
MSVKIHFKIVKAFACTECDTAYRSEDDAARCCCCAQCGIKFPKRGYTSLCGHCGYGNRLREARRRVRREEVNLRHAQEELARLLSEKKPPKGSP